MANSRRRRQTPDNDGTESDTSFDELDTAEEIVDTEKLAVTESALVFDSQQTDEAAMTTGSELR